MSLSMHSVLFLLFVSMAAAEQQLAPPNSRRGSPAATVTQLEGQQMASSLVERGLAPLGPTSSFDMGYVMPKVRMSGAGDRGGYRNSRRANYWWTPAVDASHCPTGTRLGGFSVQVNANGCYLWDSGVTYQNCQDICSKFPGCSAIGFNFAYRYGPPFCFFVLSQPDPALRTPCNYAEDCQYDSTMVNLFINYNFSDSHGFSLSLWTTHGNITSSSNSFSGAAIPLLAPSAGMKQLVRTNTSQPAVPGFEFQFTTKGGSISVSASSIDDNCPVIEFWRWKFQNYPSAWTTYKANFICQKLDGSAGSTYSVDVVIENTDPVLSDFVDSPYIYPLSKT